MRAVGYTRVSTEEQGRSGLGLDAQRLKIERHVEYKEWELVGIFEDVASGKSTNGRHGLDQALECLRGPNCAEVLIVAKLDRLSRSVADFAAIMARAQAEGWGLVALDLDIDTTTPNGELVANMMAALSQWERRIIGERTKDALAAARAKGVHLGRKVDVDEKLRRRIKGLRSRGWSYPAIAKKLNDESLPTLRGGREWYPSTVRGILTR